MPNSPGRDAVRRGRRRIVAPMYAPPPSLTISEWADRYRKLSSEDSAAPGQWVTDNAPYQREPMDALCDPLVEDVVLMWGSQMGKTQLLLNVIGYYVDQSPSPILLLQPTEMMAESFSKDRFASMLRDTPVLRGKVKDPRSRDSGNAILHKVFSGGHISMAGANSPASLASRPIRILLCDEIDRFPSSAGSEGDPVNLARKRTTTFWNRKRIYTSTPTLKGSSRIESLFEASDRRRFYVPCPHCDTPQVLLLGNLKWTEGQPSTAYYVCENGCEITHDSKMEMLRAGEWRPENPDALTRGFWINELYSPWVSWGELAAAFLEAKRGGIETLKTFINTSLCESWEVSGESVDDGSLRARREHYEHEVPEGALLLTAGIDVQHDRLEVEVVGWGPNDESWSVDYLTFRGEIDQSKRAAMLREGVSPPDPWKELDVALRRRYVHSSGATMPISAAMLDSGDGSTTHQVYDFCGPRRGRRIWACKGVAGMGRPLISPHPSRTRNGAVLWILGVDSGKEHLYANLRLEEPGPGFCHYPDRAEYGEEFFKQLTAEKATTKHRNGFPYRVWQRTRARNEVLDCRIYAMAACEALRPNFPALLANLQRAATKPVSPPSPPPDVNTPNPPTAPIPPLAAPENHMPNQEETCWSIRIIADTSIDGRRVVVGDILELPVDVARSLVRGAKAERFPPPPPAASTPPKRYYGPHLNGFDGRTRLERRPLGTPGIGKTWVDSWNR